MISLRFEALHCNPAANAKGIQAADEMLRIANNLQRG
jgi:hypothetical protein